MAFFEWIQGVDITAVRFVREQLSCEFLDFLMPLITLLGEWGIVPIILSVVMMCFKKTRKAGFIMALSILLGFIVGNLALKNIVARPRPYSVDADVALLINKLGDYSFPSGHTLVTFECAVCLLVNKYRKIGTFALIMAILVAFSRVYLYVHYPTDIIAGALLGTAFAFASGYIVNVIYSRLAAKGKINT